MTAAIYARKSTAQDGADPDAKSTARQIENARAFAAAKGWTVDERHIYTDDAVSGAETTKLVNRQRLLDALRHRPPFHVLIIRDASRFSRRDGDEAFGELKRIAQAGVEIWFYQDGTSFAYGTLSDNVVGFVRAEMNAEFRRQVGKWTREAMVRKAAAGHVCGGRTFGYDNIRVDGHVERRVNAAEAAVVVRIFELFAGGVGLKTIATQLTASGAPAPRPFTRTDPFGLPPLGAWCPSTVRAVLRREDYRGVYVYGKTRKRKVDGTVHQRPRPESEWLRTPKPEWRLVSDELWNTVVDRIRETESRAVRFADGRLAGRPPRGAATNLLAGIATCGICGSGLQVETYESTTGQPRKAHYVCARRRVNGGCANGLRIPLADMHEAVLQAIEEHALTPEAVEQVVLLSERDDLAEQKQALDAERKDIERRIRNLLRAIEGGTNTPTALTDRLQELQERVSQITTELRDLRPVPRLAPAVVETRLEQWRRLLRGSVSQGRAVLDRVLAGRIVFTPHVNFVSGEVDGYEFTGPTRVDKLFTGMASVRPKGLDPTDRAGLEDIGPEDTFDGDYGRILERALHRAKVASLTVPSWNQVYCFLNSMRKLKDSGAFAA